MKYKIELTENWRPDKRSFFTPGVYRVPEDLSEALAEQALNEGAANRLEVSKPKATFPVAKAISAAPENKAKVVGDGGGSGDGSVAYTGDRNDGFKPYRSRRK